MSHPDEPLMYIHVHIISDEKEGSTRTGNDFLALSCQSLIEDPKENPTHFAEEKSDAAGRVSLVHWVAGNYFTASKKYLII